jgi:hypothetical protein
MFSKKEISQQDNPILKPLVKKLFCFHCHPQVTCFKDCCRKLDLYLYPYDVIQLKNCLKLHSAEFMRRFTRLSSGSHNFFPSVMLLMDDNTEQTCPFLDENGCTVYKARPSACRTYPLERAVEKTGADAKLSSFYFMTDHEYCKGHLEEKQYTIKQWEREQQLYDCNYMNDLWAEVDAYFATNPWQGEGVAGPRQKLAFMICYNIDEFREYCFQNRLLDQFRLEKLRRRRIAVEDSELQKFGFDWLFYILGERRTLCPH